MKIVIIFFFMLLSHIGYTQSLMTPKEGFFYGLSVTSQNASSRLNFPGFIGTSDKTFQWGDFYASYFDKENYIKAVNDEFKRVPYLKQKFQELNEGITNVDFNKTFYFTVKTGFGTYNTECGCFPLNAKDFLEYNPILLDIKEVGNYKLAYDKPFARFKISNYANFDDFDYAFKINSSEAEKFIESRKDNSGNISRQITLKVIYNLTKKANDGIMAYIHKIEFYNGQSFLGSIMPKHDYYDKIKLIKIKNGTDTVYYNSRGVRTGNKYSAATYRVINFLDGKVTGPVKVYYMSGKFYTECNYGENTDDFDYNGLLTWYYENGQKYCVAQYEKGYQNGKFVSWYSNGGKKEEVNFVNGKKEGCDYKWEENGKPNRLLCASFDCFVDYYRNGEAAYNEGCNKCPCKESTSENTVIEDNKNSSISQVTETHNKSDFIDHYNVDFSDVDYKVFNNTLYYKSNNLEITSFSVNDVNGNIITNAKSKVGFPIFLKITVKGLTSKGGKTKFTLSKYEESTNGTLVSSETEKEEGNDNPTIPIAGGVRILPNNANSMVVHLSFSIKDRNSDSVIHGFFDYTAVE